MSWTNELYAAYELISKNLKSGILPISHSTQNAQIEVVIDERGNYKDARSVDKKEALTIIPVTEDSGTRSSGIAPMPLADKLKYIAGDYSLYSQEENEKKKRKKQYATHNTWSNLPAGKTAIIGMMRLRQCTLI